jgi:hypothetical protein
MESDIIFGLAAPVRREITLKDDRVAARGSVIARRW